MSGTVFNIAIHHLSRVKENYQVVPGNGALEDTPTTRRVVDEMHKVYARRPSKSYGKFVVDETNYPTPSALRAYVQKKTSFVELTLALMETLKVQAQQKPTSEGGHVFFAHFIREGIHYFLVSIVTDKLSAMLTNNSGLADITHLDIDGYRFAGRINLSGWAAGEDRYIGFLKGKGQVSEYFKQFLGCDTTIQRRIETTEFVDALEDFWRTQKTPPHERDEQAAKAAAICGRYSKEEQEISFVAFANELLPSDPEPLIEYLCDPDRRLNDGFVPDKRALSGLTGFKFKTKDWSISFERTALRDGKVVYNAKENTVTLTGIPEEFAQELRHEIND